jgi:uncharacterized SAM-binding protein YcdF (DUF218 family)
VKAAFDFLEPQGLVFVGLGVFAVMFVRQRQRLLAAFAVFLWLITGLVSCTPFASWLIFRIERPWKPVKLDSLEVCDAVVCLGGGLEPSRLEPTGLRTKGGADRLFCALEMTRQGKAKALVLGGGGFRFHDERGSEAEAGMAWIKAWKLTDVPLHSLGICNDTHDEALKTAALATQQGWKRIALVTSAYHMTRSKSTFEKAGLRVVPVPCNYVSQQMRQEQSYWFKTPDVTGYGYAEAWMHEVVGEWVYRWRGWIE